jgi:hypothetical protein
MIIKGLRADYSSRYYCVDEMGFIFIRGTCPIKYVDVMKR